MKFSRSAKIFVCSQFCFCGKNKFIYFSPVFDQKQKKSGQNYFCEVFVAFAKTVKIRILHQILFKSGSKLDFKHFYFYADHCQLKETSLWLVRTSYRDCSLRDLF